MRRKLLLFIAVALFQVGSLEQSVWAQQATQAPQPQAAPTTALIIIDMQPEFVTRNGVDGTPENARKVAQVLQAQVEAIAAARRSGIPIIFIEYVDSGVTNPILTRAAAGYAQQTTFTKDSDGMFDSYNSHRDELVTFLQSINARNLIITGANGGACVEASITGALDMNFNVVAYDYGIADFNYDEFIYPYTGQYGGIHPPHPTCTFRETARLEDAIPDPPIVAPPLTSGPTSSAGPNSTGEPTQCSSKHPLSEVQEFCEGVSGTVESQGH